MPADLLSAKLINRKSTNTDVFSGRFADRQTCEEVRRLRVVPVSLVAVLLVEIRENQEILFMRREWLQRVWNLVISSRLLRKPIFFPHTIRKEKARHTHRGLNVFHRGSGRSCLRGGAQHLAHCVQQRKAERHAHSPEEGAAWE